MKLSKFLIYLIVVTCLLSCSSYKYTAYNSQRIDLVGQQSDSQIDSLVAPYRRELSLLMNQKIGTATQDLFVARPNSTLGNWVSDCVLKYGKDSLHIQEPVIALLNTGGIRASISAGSITVGDIFKVMPFDNQIVAIKLPIKELASIANYLKSTGGEPIAGCYLSKEVIVLNTTTSDYFWVITTDFLANGGDKMLFFQQALEKLSTTKLLRDILLERVVFQKTIPVIDEKRIEF